MTLVVRAFAMCLAAGIVFCASAGMARSAPLRERAGPPVPHGEAGQVVLWQGEEVSIGPKGAADPNYSESHPGGNGRGNVRSVLVREASRT